MKRLFTSVPLIVTFVFLLPQASLKSAGAPPAAAPLTATAEASALPPPPLPAPYFDPSKPYNVQDFGAKGDGEANDAEAINQAIEKCSAGGGGTVTFPNA